MYLVRLQWCFACRWAENDGEATLTQLAELFQKMEGFSGLADVQHDTKQHVDEPSCSIADTVRSEGVYVLSVHASVCDAYTFHCGTCFHMQAKSAHL